MPASKAASVQARVWSNSTPPEKVSHEPREISETSRSEEPSLRYLMPGRVGAARWQSRAADHRVVPNAREVTALRTRWFGGLRPPLGLLWSLGIAAEAAALILLFRGDEPVTAVAVINRSVGGSFIVCGLIAWQLRPDSRTGPLMTLTGFLFVGEALLTVVGSDVAYTVGQWIGNWWTPPFAALVLGFPSGRLSSRIDRGIIAAFIFGGGLLQLVWLFFLPFPAGHENVFLISADPGTANTIDRIEA